jgi:Na+/H+ antiporter NhaD/arsenite permease-like protein
MPGRRRARSGHHSSPSPGRCSSGLVADDDGLFAAAGHQLARLARSGNVLFLGATAMIGGVTAVLNLDTSVAFLTPVLVYMARSRGEGEAPLLYGCLLLSNASSLFLPARTSPTSSFSVTST